MATRVHSLSSSRLLRGAVSAAALAALAGAAHADFAYSDFSSIEGLSLAGVAHQGDSVIHLTEVAGGRSAAAVWHEVKQDLMGGFTTTFTYSIPEMTGIGADGVAFVIQNSSVTALGGNGGGLGYANNFLYGGSGIANSLAVEFDMWDNKVNGDWNDLDHNHVSIQTAGILPNSADQMFSLGAASIPGVGQEGLLHTARIEYFGGIMTVYMDDLANPVLTVQGVDLSHILNLDNGSAWVGITAANGGNRNLQSHSMHSWTFGVIPAPAGAAVLGLGGLAMLRRRR